MESKEDIDMIGQIAMINQHNLVYMAIMDIVDSSLSIRIIPFSNN